MVRADIEQHFDPAGYNRFVRVSRGDGAILYTSPVPKDGTFDPASLPAPAWPDHLESWRAVRLPEGPGLMLVSHHFATPGGERYMVEAGAPLDPVRSALKQCLILLAVALPVLDLAAIAAGYWLLNRALRPVQEIAASAERVTSHNLNERLPVALTGDELDHLAGALNRMIERLDVAFQYSRRFVADASHELRTPLTILRGELEGMVAKDDLPDETRKAAASLLSTGKPSRARRTAGARLRLSGSAPYFFAIHSSAAGSPGMAAASAPSRERLSTALPSLSRYIFALAA